MPKMRGFLRSKTKIDEAEWAITEMRTAARLGDLFASSATPSVKDTDAKVGEEAAPDLSSIIVGPGPWPGGTRPPIIVVGVSDVVSVLGQGGAVQPTAVTVDADPVEVEEKVSPAKPIGVMAQTDAGLLEQNASPAKPIGVMAQTDASPVDEKVSPAKPIGVMAQTDASPVDEKVSPAKPIGFTGQADSLLVKLKASTVKPIGVMARPGDAVAEDTWRLPGVLEPDLVAAPPPAAHLFPTQPVPSTPPSQEGPAEPPTPARPEAGPSAAGPSPAAVPDVVRGPAAVQAERRHSQARRSEAGPAAGGRPSARRATRTRTQTAPEPAARRSEASRVAVGHPPARRATRTKARSAPVPVPVPLPLAKSYCPYCAKLLEPAPTTSKRCDRCRQRIVVRRIDGAAVYLTEAAVLVFEAERRRVMNSARWTRDRDRWLRLASVAGAPPERQAQLAAARLSDDVVAAARKLYLITVDRAFRAARGARDWDEAARLRRDEAAALFRVAGSPMPPPADVVEVFREGVAAELRGVAEIARDAELVSARCCDACRGDDRVIVRITQELRTPRLPHAGCPKGLCRCHWDLAARARMTMRRYMRRRPGAEARVATAAAEVPSA